MINYITLPLLPKDLEKLRNGEPVVAVFDIEDSSITYLLAALTLGVDTAKERIYEVHIFGYLPMSLSPEAIERVSQGQVLVTRFEKAGFVFSVMSEESFREFQRKRNLPEGGNT